MRTAKNSDFIRNSIKKILKSAECEEIINATLNNVHGAQELWAALVYKVLNQETNKQSTMEEELKNRLAGLENVEVSREKESDKYKSLVEDPFNPVWGICCDLRDFIYGDGVDTYIDFMEVEIVANIKRARQIKLNPQPLSLIEKERKKNKIYLFLNNIEKTASKINVSPEFLEAYELAYQLGIVYLKGDEISTGPYPYHFIQDVLATVFAIEMTRQLNNQEIIKYLEKEGTNAQKAGVVLVKAAYGINLCQEWRNRGRGQSIEAQKAIREFIGKLALHGEIDQALWQKALGA